jgi:N-formylglutamate deformylase
MAVLSRGCAAASAHEACNGPRRKRGPQRTTRLTEHVNPADIAAPQAGAAAIRAPAGDEGCAPPCRIETDADRSPLVAAAIHAGHAVRPSLLPRFALDAAARRYEEDPFTDEWTAVAPTRVIGTASRFEVDLNRPADGAVYRRPEDAWGLHVWREPLSDDELRLSLCRYRAFYRGVERLLARVVAESGGLLLLDLHSYNHRRDGPAVPAAPAEANPEINVGTGNVPARWRPVADAFIGTLGAVDLAGRTLDVRENVKFRGGHFPRWVNESFGHAGCALAVEFRKSFMDEHTGVPDRAAMDAIGTALRTATAAALAALDTA